MGKIQIDHTGSGGGITLSSDGTDLLLGGTAIGGGGASAYTIDDKTADYTAVSGDLGKIIRFTVDSAVTLTLPTASSVGEGWYITVFSSGGNIVTVARTGSSSDLFDSNQYNSGSASTFVSGGSSVTFVSDGSSVWHSLSENIYFYAEYNQNTGLFKPQATAKSAIAIGRSATASGTNSMALGSNSSFLGSVSAGSGSVALNGSYASGTNSLAAAIASNSSSYGATGANSVAMGQQAKAGGADNVAIGYSTLSNGTGSISLGYNAGTNSNYAAALGNDALANATRSLALGYSSQALSYGSTAIGYDARCAIAYGLAFGLNGSTFMADTGFELMQLCCDTTDATATVMTTDNSGASDSNTIKVDASSIVAFDAMIVARQQDDGGTDCAIFKVTGAAREESGNSTVTLLNSATTVVHNPENMAIAVSANTSNGTVDFTFTGLASHNIRAVATVQVTRLKYD